MVTAVLVELEPQEEHPTIKEGQASYRGPACNATGPVRATAPRTPEVQALRRARTCYDHLAGELGVAVAAALQGYGLLVAAEGKRLNVTPAGAAWFASVLGIVAADLKPGRHGVAPLAPVLQDGNSFGDTV